MHWWQSAFPSTSKSQSHDDSVIPSGNGKHGFFSSRRHRLLTRAKKLLQPIDVGSPAHCNKHSARPQVTSPAAAASPLPLPELQRDHEPARSSSGVPLPSPNDINMRKECGEREKDMRNAEIMDGRDVDRRQIVGVGQGSIQKRENKAKRHTKTASLESYINIASSAPSTPFSMSPVRDIAPPAFFQVPDQHQPQPPTESHVGGCSCHTHTISLDNSPIHSPKLLVPPTSSPRLRETNALHPLPLPPLSPTRPASRPDLSGAALHLLSPTPISPSPAPAPIKSKWQKGKLIGRGTFGSVYVASNRETGALCAMKEVEILPDDSKSAECIRQLEQEITLLSRLKHRNIVQYYGSEVVGDKFYIYLEYVHPGSINKFIHDHCGAITESVVRNFTRHILFGLAYLHSQKTIHRDIKGANLLVDAYGVVKLADFGMAKHLNGQTAYLSLKGSPYWMAPELLQSSMQTDATTDIALAVDIWSLGCTIIEMMNGKPPWSEYEGPAALFKVLKETPPIPETMSAEGKDFLQCCFRRNPADRPAASRLLDHPFVNYSNEPDEIKESTQFLRDKPADQVPMNKNWMLSNNFSFSMCDSFTPVRISDGAISKHPI